jgi:hypothetical protein
MHIYGVLQDHLPLGFIFAVFMLATVSGTVIFQQLVDKGYALTTIMTYTLFLASVFLGTSAVFSSFLPRFLSFVAYEVCIGIYFPTMGTLRSKLLPEQYRTALMSWYGGIFFQKYLIFVQFTIDSRSLYISNIGFHYSHVFFFQVSSSA